MEFLLVGLIAGVIGGLPLDIGRDGWLFKWGILTVGLTLIWWLVAFLAMPHLIGPFWGGGLTAMIIIGMAVNVIWSGSMSFGDNDMPWLAIVAGCAVILLPSIRGCAGWSAFRYQDYRAFVADASEQREWETAMAPVDQSHIRMVSKEQAEWIGNKVLGQAEGSLGSRYQVGDFCIQKVGDELVWVAPLEYNGFFKWTKYDYTTGYVKVYAEDRSREAELVTGQKLRYLDSAYFGDRLKRHVYKNGYQARGAMDYTFEIDDGGKPWYVITLYRPTIQYWGEEVEGVLIVDPETGDMNEYGLDEVPPWVDRVIPEKVAYKRLRWYGKFIQGWWNSWIGEENVNIPTSSVEVADMWLVWGEDGQAYWFTGLTSSKTTDQSLVGFAMMNSRTGETGIYRLSGSDETAIYQAVNSAVSNYANWHATQPILYNVYGELTWVVPVISNEGIFQRLAMVRASTSEVVLGGDKREALNEYRKLIQVDGNFDAPSNIADLKKLRGSVCRLGSDIQQGDTTYYLVVCGDGGSRIFTGTSTVSYEMPVTAVGDEIEIGYLETAETTVPLSSFDNLGIASRVSERQQAMDERVEVIQEAERVSDEAGDARAKLANMTDDELAEFMRNREETPRNEVEEIVSIGSRSEQ